MFDRRAAVVSMLAAWLCGCGSTSYLTPTEGVAIPEITEPDIAAALATRPATSFPARMIVTRLQGNGYEGGYGVGRYTVVTARDLENVEDFARLKEMPGVADVGGMSRLFLRGTNESTKDLRTAAAQLRGDVLLIYTVDSRFRSEDKPATPIHVLTLGFLKKNKTHVTATVAAAFLDVRTGFVFGAVESTATETQRDNTWSSLNRAEIAQRAAETKAFAGALDEVERAWAEIYLRYGTGAALGARLLE